MGPHPRRAAPDLRRAASTRHGRVEGKATGRNAMAGSGEMRRSTPAARTVHEHGFGARGGGVGHEIHHNVANPVPGCFTKCIETYPLDGRDDVGTPP